MEIISYGYKLPKINDKDFWDTYNFDIDRLSTHNHDGVNSSLIRAGAIDPFGFAVEVADWLVNVPSGYYVDCIFPLIWDMNWTDAGLCPVQVVFRTTDNKIAFPEYVPTPSGDGIRVYSPFVIDLLVGVY